MNDTLEKALESLIDSHGLANVIESIAQVCSLKAEHIRENWQDEPTARAWDAEQKRLNKAHARIMVS